MKRLTVAFCLLFAVSLLVGDGKQPFVDIFWALGILILYAIRYASLGSFTIRPLPRSLSRGWIVLLLYMAGRTLFSDSIAYSVSASIRYIEGYLLFILFYSVASDGAVMWYRKSLITIGFIAIGLSWVFMLFPSFAEFLPLMNLLYANYGHNHLADLLLPIFPLIFFTNDFKKLRWVIVSVFILGMILTFARAAWMLLVVYLLGQFLWRRDRIERRVIFSFACLFLVLFGAVSFISLRYDVFRFEKSTNALIRQIVKRPITQDSRWGYWRQAAMAIAERPLFGSGPGTFFLQSKRLQEAPQTYSWYAHSFPLETVVELGFVGAVLLIFILGISLRRSFWSPLFVPIVLILLYSVFEFNLNYSSIWLLFWASLGLASGSVSLQFSLDSRTQYMRTKLFLFVLLLFYLSSMAGVLFGVLPGKKQWAWYAAPYYKQNALDALLASSYAVQKGILWLNRRDPEVMYATAKTDMGINKQDETQSFYENAIRWDPINVDYHIKYIQYLFEKRPISPSVIGLAINRLSQVALPQELRTKIARIDFGAPEYASFYTRNNADIFAAKTPTAYAKLMYLIGLSLIDKDLMETKKLWLLARDFAPDWSYFSIELAALYRYRFFDSQAANDVIASCLSDRYAKNHCQIVLSGGAFSTPGIFQKAIRRIHAR
ncbi:O-antigen ligase family protein [Candidatus Gottesmanbacteria bacterium]|nr:O-antigen ligase family protein [Candidatus Gottesmanbacteria bacterium]